MSVAADQADFARAWQELLVQLAALRGDPRAESFLTRKHAELLNVVTGEGPEESTEVREGVERWFRRKLKGHTDGSRERQDLCERLCKKLKEQGEAWSGANAITRVEEALIQNLPEEGPLVCNMFAKELEGSRFEGIWISKQGPGLYKVGETRTAVQVLEGKLIVHGYFEGESLHPVREPIRTFLGEHAPAHMRSVADGDNDLFGGGTSGATQVARKRSRSPAKVVTPLPAGWEKRESRSRPGVFYYVNEAKGSTQFERPVA